MFFFVKTRLTKNGKAMEKMVKNDVFQTAVGIFVLFCEILSADVIVHTFWKS